MSRFDDVAAYVGNAGWLRVTKLHLQSVGPVVEHLLASAIADDGRVLDSEVVVRLVKLICRARLSDDDCGPLLLGDDQRGFDRLAQPIPLPIRVGTSSGDLAMPTIAQFSDLRRPIVEALRLLSLSSAHQSVVQIGTEACEVNWSPDAFFHHSLLLPLVLLTAAIDEGAAQARWRAIRFAELVAAATRLDRAQASIVATLAESTMIIDANTTPAIVSQPEFAHELLNWIDRFGLDGKAFSVDRAKVEAKNDHYATCPLALMPEMPGILKGLQPQQQLAAVVVLSLYNEAEARSAFKGRRLSSMNPVGLDALATLQ